MIFERFHLCTDSLRAERSLIIKSKQLLEMPTSGCYDDLIEPMKINNTRASGSFGRINN